MKKHRRLLTNIKEVRAIYCIVYMKKQMRLYTYSNREQSNKLYSVYEEETVTYSNREQSNILYTV